MSPNLDSKHSLDGTDTTMEESNDLREVLSSPSWKEKKSVSKDEADEDTRVVEITEFHECIYAEDWSQLEKALKNFNSRYYQRMREKEEKKKERLASQTQKEAEQEGLGDSGSSASGPGSFASMSPGPSPVPRPGLRMLRLLPQSIANLSLLNENSDKPDNPIVSPLLKVDEEGRAPLHLALLHKCPDTLILELLKEERLVARQPDNHGQLPLHVAMVHRQHDHILEQIIKAYPNALKTKDRQGRTPIGFAVEQARKAQEEVPIKENIEDHEKPFHWSTPIDEREKAWQYDQMKIWSKVEYLLKDLMRRKKNVIPSEHGLLVEGLEAGAPTKVINQLISTTDKYMIGDDDFAGSALYLCVERQYRLDTLEYLAGNCREGTTVILDYTEKALVTHYRRGCHALTPDMPSFGKEIMDWCKSKRRPDNDSNDANVKKQAFLSGASKQCREWWNILRFLLFFAAYGKDYSNKDKNIHDMHMLHAALTVSAAQPSLIQLLLVIFPDAHSELCPTFKAMPVHLACTRWRYDVLRNDKDISLEKVMKMFLKSDREQVVRRYRGRLPLHMALTVGQSWSFVKSFVSLDPKTLGMRDPHTKLFPFQLAAMTISSKNLAMVLRNRFTPTEWRLTSGAEKKLQFAKARENQDRRQIGTIYELLRRHPDAIVGKYLVRDSSNIAGDIRGAGPISSHYLSFFYRRGESNWKLNPATVKPLRDSILGGYISKSIVAWWEKLREIIWKTTPSGEIPRSDEFLLHAALYNTDTPPTIIELLLAIFPTAATKPLPGTTIYPLHIAAGTATYQAQCFEIPYSKTRMELTLHAYKDAVRLAFNGQLPIHISLSRGKTWKEVRCLVKQDKNTLLMEDPVTKLTPFELMATFRITSRNNMLRFASMAEKQTRSVVMQELSTEERAILLRDVKRNFELDVLSTVYELLRHKPSAMTKKRRKTRMITEAPSSVSSVTTEDFHSKSNGSGGIVSLLDQHLQNVETTPLLKSKQSLSTYLERGVPRGARRLVPNSPSSDPSLSRMLENGGRALPGLGSSTHSLISRNSGGPIFDDYIKPVYDDETMSAMVSSTCSMSLQSSSLNLSNHTATTPGSSSSRRRAPAGTKFRNRLPKLPDLNMDE